MYLQTVLWTYAAIQVLHVYLDLRQLRALRQPKPPPQLSHYTEDEYKRTQAYNLDKWWFGVLRSVFTTGTVLAQLLCGYLPWLWLASKRAVAKQSLLPSGEIQTSIAFVVMDSVVQAVIDLPWSLYSTFVLEQRHGFNQTTPRTYVADMLKTWALGLTLGPPIIAGAVYILRNGGPFLALYLWGALLALSVVMMTAYPTLIAPLFNDFKALPEGSLRTQIEDLAGSLKFPLTQLFVVDGSRRSAHSNAYMYGFFKNQRIVLFDTLIEQCQESQVTAVIAHELAHWQLGHNWKNFVVMQAVALGEFSLFSLVQNSPGLLASFGFLDERPALIKFMLFNYMLGPVDEVLRLFANALSRRFEYQADEFAVRLGKAEDLKGGLLSLDAKNRSPPACDPLYSAVHYSHPPLVERLQAIDVAAKKAA